MCMAWPEWTGEGVLPLGPKGLAGGDCPESDLISIWICCDTEGRILYE